MIAHQAKVSERNMDFHRIRHAMASLTGLPLKKNKIIKSVMIESDTHGDEHLTGKLTLDLDLKGSTHAQVLHGAKSLSSAVKPLKKGWCKGLLFTLRHGTV